MERETALKTLREWGDDPRLMAHERTSCHGAADLIEADGIQLQSYEEQIKVWEKCADDIKKGFEMVETQRGCIALILFIGGFGFGALTIFLAAKFF